VRFDQILIRTENCKKYVTNDDKFSVVENVMYHAALALGQEGSVEELLGNFKV
jgi:hypothetical protein